MYSPNCLPQVYSLITNDGTYIVNGHPTTQQLCEYYALKYRQGIPIKEIVFRIIPYKVLNTREVIQSITGN